MRAASTGSGAGATKSLAGGGPRVSVAVVLVGADGAGAPEVVVGGAAEDVAGTGVDVVVAVVADVAVVAGPDDAEDVLPAAVPAGGCGTHAASATAAAVPTRAARNVRAAT
ncbi:hypothetical protein [Kineosporia sp. R_H_3]|uniref:hypothetical protein n=1 Tax=Kineosporia sp. R_H_3 TaxID=1961848 RepID=UPI0013042789|nr:hypothetical protein [Kineosporia sp. R_H_3]